MLKPAHRWALVGMGAAAMAISFLERQTLAVLAPTVCKALALSNTQYGFIGSAFALAHLAAIPLAGVFLDRVGVRRGMLLAVLAWAAAEAAHGLAAGFATLLVARLLLGVAEAPGFPGAAQVVRSVAPPEHVARGIGFVLSGSTAGVLLALFVAVALEQRFGWRAAFAGVAGIALLWTPLWAALSAPAREQLDVPRQAQATAPVFTHPAVVRAVLFTFGASPLLAFAALWWPKFLVARHAVAQADIPWYGFALPIAYDLGAVALGDLAGRVRRDGLLLAASALALCIAFVPFAHGPWQAVALAAAGWFGVGGAFAMSTAGALIAVEKSAVSRAGATISTAYALGFVIWNPLIGWSVDRTGSYTPAFAFATFAIAAGAVAWAVAGRSSAALRESAAR